MDRLLPDSRKVRQVFRSREGIVGTIVFVLSIARPAIQLIRGGVDLVSEIQTVEEVWPYLKDGALWIYNASWLNPLAMLAGAGLIWHSLRTPPETPPESDDDADTVLVPSPIPPEPDTVFDEEHQGAPTPYFQIEQSGSDIRTVLLDNDGAHLTSPDGKFNAGAFVAAFTNHQQDWPRTVRAQVSYFADSKGSRGYIVRTVHHGTWLEAPSGEITIEGKDTRYLILGLTKIQEPSAFCSIEDHRNTVHADLGVEVRALPKTARYIDVEIILDGGESKQFSWQFNPKTFRVWAK